MEILLTFFVWPAIVLGSVLAYGWFSARQAERESTADHGHKVPGE